MKKYLMTGMAAVIFGGLFTSCSHDIESSGSPQEQIQKTYEEAFVTRFGTPASTVDWGFGTSRSNTRTENANANEWADPNKAYGGLLVPPAITPEQAAVVKAYFQTVPNLDYDDPGWSNYFIQQVYKGHTSVPEGCATPEAYLAANGSTLIIASDHMDHLIAVDTEKGIYDHINNFNHGDCSENGSVLDNGGNANDGPWHTDKIMYMMNSTTKSFGYHNSDGSLYHTEYTGLVGWKTIHDWAIDNYPGYDGCLKDDWNRSFMGFDFEQMVGDDVYVKGVSRPDASGNWQWYPDEYKTFEFEGKTYNFLTAETNMYAADWNEPVYHGKVNYNDKPSDDIIRDLLSKGYLPYSDTLKDWVKVGGTADGYFSDWIVTLTEAKTENKEEWEAIRVIAEDLTVESDKEGNSDFDFNDIVFDVRRCISGPSQGTVQVIIKAAGGTLPLYIDGKEVHQLYAEANPTLSIDQYTMINTHAENKSLKGISGLDDIVFTPTTYSGNTIGEIANSIEVYVIKGGEPCPLTAPKGDVASKVAVGTDFDWCNERQDIDNKYSLDDGTSLFKEYVKGALGNRWYYTFTKK